MQTHKLCNVAYTTLVTSRLWTQTDFTLMVIEFVIIEIELKDPRYQHCQHSSFSYFLLDKLN